MKKYLIDFICLFILSLCSITIQAQSVAPSWQWAKRPNIEITAYTIPALSSDGNGNIYVTGGFVGTATFATLPAPTTLISAGESDIFIAKYDASGNVLWAKRAGSIHVDIAYASKNFQNHHI